MNDQNSGVLDFLNELSDELDQEGVELSRRMVNHLFVLLRSTAMHELSNDALSAPLNKMIEVVSIFFEKGADAVDVSLIDGNFFINGRLLQLDYSTFENTRYLRKIFEFLGVGQVVFNQRVSEDDLRRLLEGFLSVVSGDVESIQSIDLGSIYVGDREIQQYDDLYGADDPRQHILGVYASGLLMLRQFVNDLRKGLAPRYPKMKRLCLQLIDVDAKHHNLLIALTHLEAYKGNLFCHMLHTGVLCIAFGKRIGLNREQLLDLGMTAFYHNLGWPLMGTLESDSAQGSALTLDGILKQKNGSDPKMDDLRVRVARALVRIGGFNEMVISRLIVAYETQIPSEKPSEGLYYGEIGANFMTHIVRMASRYDELTSPSISVPLRRPDEAMKIILDDDGVTYNPFLATLFVHSLGIYPVGTLVELDTSEVGLVVNLPTDPVHFNRPQVKILIDRSGRQDGLGQIVDLAQTDRSGRFLRSVDRTYDARNFGISITRFFFGDGASGEIEAPHPDRISN